MPRRATPTRGRTVDRALLYLDGPTNVRGIYVPLTRDRLSNHVYLTLHDDRTAIDIVAESLRQDWIDTPAIDRRSQRQQPDRSAGLEYTLRPLPAERLRELLGRHNQLTPWIARHDSTANQLRDDITRLTSERDKAQRQLESTRKLLAAAERTLERYDKPLIRRRHYHQIGPARHNAATAHHNIRYFTNRSPVTTASSSSATPIIANSTSNTTYESKAALSSTPSAASSTTTSAYASSPLPASPTPTSSNPDPPIRL